eukprot:scaffold1122_cov50-Phaeocystis_antarctica.AAC.1
MQRTSSPAAQRGQPARGGGGGGGASFVAGGWALCVAPRCDDVSCVCVRAVCVCVVCVKSRVCKAVVSVGCVCVCACVCLCGRTRHTRSVEDRRVLTSPLSIAYTIGYVIARPPPRLPDGAPRLPGLRLLLHAWCTSEDVWRGFRAPPPGPATGPHVPALPPRGDKSQETFLADKVYCILDADTLP